jgi:hypothetical protein
VPRLAATLDKISHLAVARAFLVCSAVVLCCCGSATRVSVSQKIPTALQFAGEFSIPSLTRFPQGIGLRFGGISGLTPPADGTGLLGVSDDSTGVRVYRFEVQQQPRFAVTPVAVTYLTSDPRAPARLDPEAIAVLPDGNVLIASEGYGAGEPREPPALVEFRRGGEFVRQLAVRDRFVPSATGPVTRGVRSNAAFESLTVAPGADRLFTATESPLVQDGEPASFERGAPVRILEYARRRGIYEPAREFVYMLEPIVRVSYASGTAINGLVELIATSAHDLLALERSYVAEKEQEDAGVNQVRVFRVSLAGATDVSALDSLANATVTPVTKTLVLDLSQIAGLSRELAQLENFEAMAFGPRLADGRPSLVLASDDNFRATQRTSFLLFGVDR